ncbi:MAG TPA: hypothetical protein VIW67_04210 [Terriglobales bacterium]
MNRFCMPRLRYSTYSTSANSRVLRTAMRSASRLTLTVLLVFTFSCTRANAAPEQAFWQWFQNNESSLFDFEKNREKIFNELSAEMHKVDPSLTFEFGPKENGQREFVISADGIREAFPKVEALYANAPKLPRWKFIKFRPRREPSDISYGGISIKAQSVSVLLVPNGQTADLTIFMPGYTETARSAYTTIAFLFLDEALGEYDVETRVGEVKIDSTSKAPAHTYSLDALPAAFDSVITGKK